MGRESLRRTEGRAGQAEKGDGSLDWGPAAPFQGKVLSSPHRGSIEVFHQGTDRATSLEGYPGIGFHRAEEEDQMEGKQHPRGHGQKGKNRGS